MKSLRNRTIDFFREIIKKRKNMVRLNHSKKNGVDHSIIKLEFAVSKMSDNEKAAHSLLALRDDVFNVIPKTGSVYNRFIVMYNQLCNEAKSLV